MLSKIALLASKLHSSPRVLGADPASNTVALPWSPGGFPGEELAVRVPHP